MLYIRILTAGPAGPVAPLLPSGPGVPYTQRQEHDVITTDKSYG